MAELSSEAERIFASEVVSSEVVSSEVVYIGLLKMIPHWGYICNSFLLVFSVFLRRSTLSVSVLLNHKYG